MMMMILSSAIFWETWALGMTLHWFIYHKKNLSGWQAVVVFALQVIAAALASLFFDPTLQAIMGLLSVHMAAGVTYTIIDQMKRWERREYARECLTKLDRIAGK